MNILCYVLLVCLPCNCLFFKIREISQITLLLKVDFRNYLALNFLVELNKTKKDGCLYHLFFWLFKRIDLLADKYGRKHVLMICLSITIFAGIMESLSVNFWMYLFFQTLGSLGQAGCFQTGFILALETVGKSHRYVLFWTGPNYFP